MPSVSKTAVLKGKAAEAGIDFKTYVAQAKANVDAVLAAKKKAAQTKTYLLIGGGIFALAAVGFLGYKYVKGKKALAGVEDCGCGG